ncbi:MAG: hypothetical protein PHF35_00725 [Candidatus Moranbacteria bacterium]|nr:hypothetical protein [Candidatus Moranbacteria bacterium]
MKRLSTATKQREYPNILYNRLARREIKSAETKLLRLPATVPEVISGSLAQFVEQEVRLIKKTSLKKRASNMPVSWHVIDYLLSSYQSPTHWHFCGSSTNFGLKGNFSLCASLIEPKPVRDI